MQNHIITNGFKVAISLHKDSEAASISRRKKEKMYTYKFSHGDGNISVSRGVSREENCICGNYTLWPMRKFPSLELSLKRVLSWQSGGLASSLVHPSHPLS